MPDYLQLQRIAALLTAALECSVYVSPRDHGLTYAELLEFGRLLGLQDGEIGDAMQHVSTIYIGQARIQPDPDKVMGWVIPHIEDPDYRNAEASDFWNAAMRESARANGDANPRVDRDVMIARAAGRGISKHDMEVALAIEILQKRMTDKDGVILPGSRPMGWPLLSEQRKIGGLNRKVTRNEHRARAYLVVEDIIERRSDGRAPYAEPLDAFAEKLDALGYGHFKLWWRQLVSQLRQTDTETTPVAALVLAAALVEGGLTFVVKHGRSAGVGVFGSRTFEEEPHRWRIDALVAGAAAGGKAAILDNRDRLRAEELIATRQRIHAGRMLSDFPRGVPDLRPEEAREGKAVADLVVRRILDWLERNSGTP